MSGVAPRGQFGREAKEGHLRGRNPDNHSIRYAFGEIVEVYDISYDERHDDMPLAVRSMRLRNPGKLVFGVKIRTRSDILPYVASESDEVIKSAYGNRPLLMGRRVRITYQPGRLEGGTIQILPRQRGKRTNLTNETHVADIGGIF